MQQLRPFLPPVFFLLSLALGSCNFPGRAGPTLTPTQNVTQAYQTVEARLTEAAAQTPAVSPTPVPTDAGLASPSPSPTEAPTATPPPVTPSPTPPCDRATAGNPIDLTIPDDTILKPGETFTKEWSLINSGTCSWTRDYAAVWFSGEMMGAPSTVALDTSVAPGQSVVISVDMTAPTDPGTYQSNWKLQNASSLLFGIGPNGNSPFWVRIQVVAVPTNTPQASPAATATLNVTPTPGVETSGSASLVPGETLDLDTLAVNPGGNSDLLYEATGPDTHQLTPQGGATLGVFGLIQPDLLACLSSNMSAASLPVNSLPMGTYLCYRTNQGRFGWAQLVNQNPGDFTLTLEALTWTSAP